MEIDAGVDELILRRREQHLVPHGVVLHAESAIEGVETGHQRGHAIDVVRGRGIRGDGRGAAETRAGHPAKGAGGYAIVAAIALPDDGRSIAFPIQRREHLAAAQAEERQARAPGRVQGRLELKVGEARHRAVPESIRDEPVVGATRRRPPGAGGRTWHAPFEQHVAAGQAKRARHGQRARRGPVPRFEIDDRRQPSAETGIEPGRIERDAGCRRRIQETGGELAKALRIVDLHAVQHDQIVFGAAAPDRKLPLLVIGAGNPGLYLQALKHVLQAAGHLANLDRLDRVGARAQTAFGGPIGDLDVLGDAVLTRGQRAASFETTRASGAEAYLALPAGAAWRRR